MTPWLVLMTLSDGHHVMYIVRAKNQDIARDACVRSCLLEYPSASFREIVVYETNLDTPVKILQD